MSSRTGRFLLRSRVPWKGRLRYVLELPVAVRCLALLLVAAPCIAAGESDDVGTNDGLATLIFSDDFESGDLSAWSSFTLPPAPLAGEVIFTELLYAPRLPLTDAVDEWIELTSIANGSRLLSGCELDNGVATDSLGNVILAPGGSLLLAKPGGVLASGSPFSFDLDNEGSSLSLTCGAVPIDDMTYDPGGAFPQLVEGRSLRLDPDFFDAAANDSATGWCLAPPTGGQRYWEANFGTPGAPNPDCPLQCGDGALDDDEDCDAGTGNDELGNGTCRETCLFPVCGDGTVDFILGERCDDTNTIAADGCSPSCQLEIPPLCGNDAIDSGEECDDGGENSDVASDACRSDCTLPRCGDGVVDRALGERCDDGNLRLGDGCDSSCSRESFGNCGNGALDLAAGEQCDDGGLIPGDGCDATCQLEPFGLTCSNGTVEATEVCDDSNLDNGDGCSPTCNLRGRVTTLLVGLSRGPLAVDEDYLWVGGATTMSRIAIADCIVNPQTGSCAPQLVAGAAGVASILDAPTGTDARLRSVSSLATDGSTVWFTDDNVLRSMSALAPHAVTTLAGSATVCDLVDGIGGLARFFTPRGLSYERGLLYLVDACYGVLRRYDPATNEVVTVAGQAAQPFNWVANGCPVDPPMCVFQTPADDFGLQAAFVSPRYTTSDGSGMVFVADTNGVTLRAYSTVNGFVGTVAGQGSTPGYQDGASSLLSRPRQVVTDATSLYWLEQTANTVRQVLLESAVASTLAGQRDCAGSRDGIGADPLPSACSTLLGLPQLDTALDAVYDSNRGVVFFVDGNGLRMID